MGVSIWEGGKAERLATALETVAEGIGSITSPEAVAETVATNVTAWLDENVESGETLVVDNSLTIQGAAADAKKTGDELSEVKSAITNDLSERTSQLLDWQNVQQYNATLAGASGMVASTHGKTVLVPVSPSSTDTSITVHRGIVGKRFCIGVSTNATPAIGEAVVRVVEGSNAQELSIQIDSTIKSLLIYYYLDTQDTDHTPDELLQSIMVNYGSYVGYEPYYRPYGYSELKGLSGTVETVSDSVDDISESLRIYESLRTDQLLDWEHATQYNATLSGASGMVSSTHGKTVLVPVNPGNNTTVTVHRGIVGKRFCVGVSTNATPAIGEAVVRVQQDDNAEEISISVDSTIKSVLIYYYLDTQDTSHTADQLLQTIMVNYGAYVEYEPYIRIVDTTSYVGKLEDTFSFEYGDEIMPSTITWSGTGWAENSAGQFTHTPGDGNYLPLTITLSEQTGTNFYKIEFDIDSSTDTHSPDASTAVYPSIGGSGPFSLYDGRTGNQHYSKILRSTENGNLLFQPCSPTIPSIRGKSFDGTIKNISVKQVTNIRVPSLYMMDENYNNTTEFVQTEKDLKNILIGVEIGRHLTDGYGNAGIGYKALQNITTGFWNVAIGEEALRDSTVASRNIALGYHALQQCSGGDRNVAIGSFALCRNYGFRNIAIGADTLWYNTKGYQNVAIGMATLHSNTEGNENVAVGVHALHENLTGNGNVAIGVRSGYNATGNNNTAVGVDSQIPANVSNSIAIGYNANVTESNQVVIGNNDTGEVIIGNRKLVFNQDGSVTWVAVT